jgi:stage V sporulation protein SpoVS
MENEGIMSLSGGEELDDVEVEEVHDPNKLILLKAKGLKAKKEDIAGLSVAILKSLSIHNYAEVQGVGSAAIHNMNRAFIMAKSKLHRWVDGDLALVNDISYRKVDIGGDAYTAIKMKIFAIPSKLIP